MSEPARAPGALLSGRLPDGSDLAAAVAVVGSGFGGSVAAARLAPHLGAGVLVLERGREIPLGDFPETGAEVAAEVRTATNPLGLFDVLLGTDLDVLMACTLGGGSQIYAGVTVPPADGVFARRAGGRRVWPQAVDGAVLEQHYDTVRATLAVEPWLDASDVARGGSATPGPLLGGSPAREDALDPAASGRLDAFGLTAAQRPALAKADPVRAWASRHAGVSYRPPLAISITAPPADRPGGTAGAPAAAQRPLCIHCGCCVTGCNIGAKNTLTSTYLAHAAAAGARIAGMAEVVRIRPGTRRRWLLEVVDLSRPRREAVRRVHADLVVVAAGAIRSTELLLRSAREIALSPALGTRISANGDAWMLSYDGRHRLDAAPVGEVRPGPTITISAEALDPDAGPLLVQDGAFPASTVLLASRGIPLVSGRPGAAAGRRRAMAALAHSQVWLAMGLDSSRGTAALDRRGRIRVSWPGLADEPVMRRAQAALADLASMDGGRPVVPPRRWRGGHTPCTVHALGGCPMADDIEYGVVDAAGRVHRPAGGVHAGLYVLDGSICPTALGANPSLTIAALAERAMQEIIVADLPALAPASAVT